MNDSSESYQADDVNSEKPNTFIRKVVHINPLSSHKLMVIDTHNGSVASDKLKQSTQNKEPDRDQIVRQIIMDETVSSSTYWQGLIILPPAHTYTYDARLKIGNIETNLVDLHGHRSGANDDPFELITDYISEVFTNNKCEHLVVRFSGGVDSTCLLLAAIEVAGKQKVTAITWFDDKCSANEDKNIAVTLCNKLEIKHLLFQFDPKDFFQDVNPTDHFHINPSMASDQVFKAEKDFLFSQLGDDYILLDGHGGDHLFLDPIPSIAFQQPLKETKNS